MRILSCCLAISLVSQAAGRPPHAEALARATQLKRAGNYEAAHDALIRAYDLAVDARATSYAAYAGAQAAFGLYNAGKPIAAGHLARQVITTLQTLPADTAIHESASRIDLFVILERGLQAEGKIGAGWRACRASAETVRGKRVGPEADGPPFDLRELSSIHPSRRNTGWRCILREAEYLDLAGRSNEALALLTTAADAARKDWHRLGKPERYYAIKLLSRHTTQLDFLGHTKDALSAQQRLLAETGDDCPPSVRLTLEMNYLRNLSQWQGPSEEILAKARKIADRAATLGPVAAQGMERLYAKMELDLRQSETALATLAATVARRESAGEWFEAVYSQRDSLVARSRSGEEIPDSEFAELLTGLRAQGNKRGEPTVYTEFGHHLVRTGRTAEAIPLYREALRLIRVFGRRFHEIPVLCALVDAQLETRNPDALRSALAELDASIASQPALPTERIVRAAVTRAQALVALGRPDEARRHIEETLDKGRNLPAYQLRMLNPGVVAAILDNPIALTEVPAPPTAPVRIQPAEVQSIASPNNPAQTRFAIINPLTTAITGHLTAIGPGAEVRSRALVFNPAEPSREVRLPLDLAPGSEAFIHAKTAGAPTGGNLAVTLRWNGSDSPATWSVGWDPVARESVVLDASLLDGDPFRSIAFLHHVALPPGITSAAFRLVSSEPLRIEYYETRNGQLVAIDANGNGDFSEKGDLHLRGPGGTTAAWITPETGAALEIRLFSTTGEGACPFTSPVILGAEVRRGDQWVREAEDVLR